MVALKMGFIIALVAVGGSALQSPFSAHSAIQLASSSDDLNNNDTDNGWPREISNNEQITIYQPDIESWQGNQLSERAAVSIQSAASAEPSYGVIWITARTEVDRANHLVTLEDIQIPRASFPGHPERSAEYLALLRKNAPSLVKHIALDRLQASLAVTQAESKRALAPALHNDAPEIIYSETPAILVLVDGQPVLRDTGTPNILRVINTRTLLLFDQGQGTYYLYMGDRWMEGKSTSGNIRNVSWVFAKRVPSQLDQIRDSATTQKNVDLLNDPNSALMQELQKGIMPKIYVSTRPASLIQTEGRPQLKPVSDTKLLYVENTGDTIFVNPADHNYYILLAGRWYRSRTLNGPWEHVSAKKLPSDFAKIPENHPKGLVLASVAGTPQAQEAAISNDIPQTATVNREQATLSVQYDGPPQFKPIEGTPLQYALNTSTPVIQVDPNSYYAVQNGIWFVATSPDGPWATATRVPAVIYSIPPSSPLYYVTFVHIYGATPEVVYVGYTPGYLNSYYCNEGVVVFGTGYFYRPWIGTVWIGPPVTFGFGVFWGAGFGWAFHGPFFAGPIFYPWWGPWWAWRHAGPRVTIIEHANIYRTWRGPIVRNTWDRNAIANRVTPLRPAGHANNVYGSRGGHVYRYGEHGWEERSAQHWVRSGGVRSARNPAPNRAPPQAVAHQNVPNELERSRAARMSGEHRWSSFRGFSRGATAPSRGGGRRR